MKKIFAILLFASISLKIHAQLDADITGVWQLKLGGKFIKGKTLDVEKAPYSNHNAYYLFTSDEMYFAISPDKKFNRSKLDRLIEKGLAGNGYFIMYADLESVPVEERSRFDANYKPNTFFIVGEVDGEQCFLYYEPSKRKFFSANTNPQIELIRVGSFYLD